MQANGFISIEFMELFYLIIIVLLNHSCLTFICYIAGATNENLDKLSTSCDENVMKWKCFKLVVLLQLLTIE